MTVTCALASPARHAIWIGADTLVTNCGTRMTGAVKWALAGGWAVGLAGDRRAYDAVARNAAAIFAGDGSVFDVAYALREVLRADGFSRCDDECAENLGQQMILAGPLGVFALDGAFSAVAVTPGELWADGSGRAYALGAAHALGDCRAEPEAVVRAAIEAAVRYDPCSGGEAWVRRLEMGPGEAT